MKTLQIYDAGNPVGFQDCRTGNGQHTMSLLNNCTGAPASCAKPSARTSAGLHIWVPMLGRHGVALQGCPRRLFVELSLDSLSFEDGITVMLVRPWCDTRLIPDLVLSFSLLDLKLSYLSNVRWPCSTWSLDRGSFPPALLFLSNLVMGGSAEISSYRNGPALLPLARQPRIAKRDVSTEVGRQVTLRVAGSQCPWFPRMCATWEYHYPSSSSGRCNSLETVKSMD